MILIAGLFMTPIVDAQIYKYVDENGVITYSNFRPRSGAYSIIHFKCRDCGWKSSVDWSRVPLNLEAFTDEILAACEEFGLEEALVRAVIHAESSFRHQVVSDMGAQGLMQLMPATAARFGVRHPFDPRQNIRGGVAYLKFLLEMFSYDIELAAAAYNAGENAVKKHGGVPPYNETRNFVQRVETLRKRYAKAIARLVS
ncbi:MAG: lytic transglycosylase domain-containing protein [Xanthomonadales bacterium]|nr:lytic transglycosylase domain-containing protein [Xanthomonadales bacterium]